MIKLSRRQFLRSAPSLTAAAATAILLLSGTACSLFGPPEPREILDRSLAAHGGSKLSDWRTLTVKGTVEMTDGIKYNAAYLVLAKKPDMLRVEQDMTADRGRLFYEYFMYGSLTWSRRNLLPTETDAGQLRRWWNQCFGIAYYTSNTTSMALKGSARINYPASTTEGKAAGGPESAEAYVLEVKTDDSTVELCIDKATFYLVQEVSGNVRRMYRNFRDFEGAVWPTDILEIRKGRQGESTTPFQIRSVQRDQPIEDWMFTEDMPAKSAAK